MTTDRTAPLTRRALLAALALGACVPVGAQTALPPELQRALPQARLRGEGRLRFFGLHVYDIRLWSPVDALAERWAQVPLALEIAYARTLYGAKIAERSVDEMRRQLPLPDERAGAWQAEMARLFPDVQDGDRLTGVMRPGEGAAFYFNGQPRGEVRDPDFARLFFGIWLAPQTSEPGLRQQLLGLVGR